MSTNSNVTKVLIVEDDKALREALCTTLQLAGMEFVEAECAETALIQLERCKVDIVVSDVNMPGMDGHALLNHIKQKFPELPMMLITAFGQVKMAVEAMEDAQRKTILELNSITSLVKTSTTLTPFAF